ncbi:MAG: type IX secretion system outer membrane channel protein PorV [Bacteroidales bacterium]|nr:type IX secretion system outer membrane channel protein PorV [Bacteroidales bacterium]MCF8334830.1 type IX secretion system outer membrane channel protein PorV [Bacteroidales bacterium]
MKKTGKALKALLLSAIALISMTTQAQNNDRLATITTGVPFLMISPDARGGSMGDVGVATEPSANSMFWNPAKYAFIDKKAGVSLGVSPWLSELVDDIGLYNAVFYNRLDDQQVIGATLRYFSLGSIQFTDDQGTSLGEYQPNEWAIDGTYSRKLTEKLSLAVAGRFIYSNLTLGQNTNGADTRPGTSIAADIGLYYENEMDFGRNDGIFSFGMNISNIGAKISYTTDVEKDFIPTNLRLGPAVKLELDSYNEISFALDMNKLLVPTPPIYKENDQEEIAEGMDNDVSVITGIFQSFYDAPGGFNEEMREISFAFGTEYWYDDTFALRGGYFYEDPTKGNRQYFTMGAGLKYNVFSLDFSYLIPTGQRSPLDNTLRFSLFFDFDAFTGG